MRLHSIKYYAFYNLIIIYVLLFTGCSDNENQVKNNEVIDIANTVSLENIKTSINDLVDFKTRYTHKKQIETAEYLHRRLSRYLQYVSYHEYQYWGVTWKNVIGTIYGEKRTDEIVILCAHLDSKSEERLVFAPGADDNASGVAAVLEAARVLSDKTFDRTIRFLLFTRESTGQQGSKAYVRTLRKNTEDIFAVINVDMIAYGENEEDIDIMTIPEHKWLAEKIVDYAIAYDYKIKKTIDKACY